MILDTAEKMYRYFLTQVRKEHTVVVPPTQWNEMINPIVLDWIKTKLPENEFNQKRIDDLEAIKVITDGDMYPLIPSVDFNTANKKFSIPYNVKGYPNYLHGLSVQFAYTKTTFFGARLWRSDFRVTNNLNPYRKPSDTNLNESFYEVRGNFLYAITNVELKLKFNLVLEYYSYPEEIVYLPDQNNSAGSFKPTQNKEIMDLAVTKFLENVSDPRIQTQPGVQVPG